MSSNDAAGDDILLCVDLDAALNLEEMHVFKDIVESVFRRYLTEMEKHHVESREQNYKQSNKSKKKRFYSGFIRRAKKMLTCSACIRSCR